MTVSVQSRDMVRRLLARYAPPSRVSVTEWAEAHRFLPQGTTRRPGPYRVSATPYIASIQAECTYALTGIAPPVRIGGRPWKVAVQKGAQAAYTVGVAMNVLAYCIHALRLPQMTLFAKEQAAREFVTEKLEPMITSTPCLASIIDMRSRARGETAMHRSYPGGYIKLAGSRSPTNVKSSSLPLVIVEEPDDTERDLRGQGDAITLAEERTKTYHPDRLVLIGGTPTVAGLSIVEAQMRGSDQRHYHVPCHDCGAAEPLSWEHVTWLHDEDARHPVYGTSLPDTAVYVCPHCGSAWNDHQRVTNVARAAEMQADGEEGVGWVAHAPFDGVAGYYLNELLSPFEASRLPLIARKYLEAEHAYKSGDPAKKISFANNQLGIPWEHKNEAPPADQLSERGESYDPETVPNGAGVVVASVDVQHNRLHVHRWAVGRDEESWLVSRDIIPGNTLDPTDPVWTALAELLARPLQHASGASLYVAAVGVDSSDGQTQDAVYATVKRLNRKRQADGTRLKAMAIKGSSKHDREIYTAPRRVEYTRTDKASKYGLQVHMVGVSRGKDSLASRLRLIGTGPGRMHWYASLEPEFYEQITAEVKVPGRGGRLEWQVMAGRANEDTDCAVYSQHAWRSLRAHVWTENQWRAIEARLARAEPVETTDEPPEPPPQRPPVRPRRRRGGWMSGRH